MHVRCNDQALGHLSFNAHLLSEEQRQETATEDYGPEKEGRRDDGGVVGRKHEMVEEERQREV